ITVGMPTRQCIRQLPPSRLNRTIHLLSPIFLLKTRRPPHSQLFPTRRSSDLRRRDRRARAPRRRSRRPPRDRPPATRPGRAVYRDRKSTRLNSRHVAISYDVFFLKKKNYEKRKTYDWSVQFAVILLCLAVAAA